MIFRFTVNEVIALSSLHLFHILNEEGDLLDCYFKKIVKVKNTLQLYLQVEMFTQGVSIVVYRLQTREAATQTA